MQPTIDTLSEMKLVAMRIRMSFSDNRTGELWQRFMSQRSEIKHKRGRELYSVEIYPPAFFEKFDDKKEFEKLAAVEVTDFNCVPDNMEAFVLQGGRYAVFVHNGPASAVAKTYRYILETWLPDSGFILDNRPHIAIMGEKYKNEDMDSEEELLIPVKLKASC